ncbi:hypothetical protein RIEGSTA812A_PEG_973 [invertebrate metagenome]|uniref:Uncharacterized protein n=1 Tax=invertebrate metagenome TaxID=1711999 RepID=A0A484H7D6_9ZZZZ
MQLDESAPVFYPAETDTTSNAKRGLQGTRFGNIKRVS